MKTKSLLWILPWLWMAVSCEKKQRADLLIFDAQIHTLDPEAPLAEAMVVNRGQIVFAGSQKEARRHYDTDRSLKLEGKFVYPGFIDAHCHFLAYGLDLAEGNLKGTSSWEDVLNRTRIFAAAQPEGWLIARGWDQNDWSAGFTAFPTNKTLNELFPDRPVLLERIDGHAGLVNQAALDAAGFTSTTRIIGGHLEQQAKKLTGVLLDAALDSIRRLIPEPGRKEMEMALLRAQEKCFSVGLTTVSDAGLEHSDIQLIDSMHRQGTLKMRVYAMVSDQEASKKYYFERGPLKTDRLNVRAVKYYADGALGSRGALLLKPYSDVPSESGLQQQPAFYFESEARRCLESGFQMCTHAIGDSANRMMLQIYAKMLGGENDKRWRMEHCQVIAPEDFILFRKFNIVPSVQTTHATSDMPWAPDRLGPERIKGAYAYKTLLEQNGWIANGSDFPVEDISPLFGFYAAVARKDQEGKPAGGFQMENAMSRDQALRAMTIWAAMANMEESEKGSLEAGKVADFVVLDQDLQTAPEAGLFSIKVLATYVNGEKVFAIH